MSIAVFVDMSRRQTLSSIDTDDGHRYVIHKTPINFPTRLRNFFGIPKPIENDDESWCEWRSFLRSIDVAFLSFNLLAPLTLLCATSFIEDAVFYKSTVHKVSKAYLYVYRWYSSPFIQRLDPFVGVRGIVLFACVWCRLHRLALTINLCLAFFEKPSSFSVTSDVRDRPQRVEFPFALLMIVEGLTLVWFLIYICTKVTFSVVHETNNRLSSRM